MTKIRPTGSRRTPLTSSSSRKTRARARASWRMSTKRSSRCTHLTSTSPSSSHGATRRRRRAARAPQHRPKTTSPTWSRAAPRSATDIHHARGDAQRRGASHASAHTTTMRRTTPRRRIPLRVRASGERRRQATSHPLSRRRRAPSRGGSGSSKTRPTRMQQRRRRRLTQTCRWQGAHGARGAQHPRQHRRLSRSV